MYVIEDVDAGESRCVTDADRAIQEYELIAQEERDLFDAASPIAIAVAPLKSLSGPLFESPLTLPLTLQITRILLEVLDGVIDAESPVMSVNDVLVVVNTSVFVVLTT